MSNRKANITIHIIPCLYLLFSSCFITATAQNTQKSLDIPMVKVDGGTFLMGSDHPEAYFDEQPVHEVFVSSFCIGKYEITVAQYRRFCLETKRSMPEKPEWGWIDSLPMVNVTWQDAVDFCTWAGGRLPTEAEWEFAARGGNHSKGYVYSGSNEYNKVAWSLENAPKQPQVIGKKQPNELGIHDMSGNVWEWCSDWYGLRYYSSSEVENPKGPQQGNAKVNRGGCWNFDRNMLPVFHRRGYAPHLCGIGTGIRLVKDI